MERGGPDGLAGAHGDGCLSWRCGPGRGCTVGSCVDFPRAERYELSAATANVINERRRAGGCVMVCGTSALRTMETVADDAGLLWPQQGFTQLIISPGHQFRACDAFLTNLHAR